MALRRSNREKKTVRSYKSLNAKGFEEELDYSDDQLEMEADPQGEKLLCGSDFDTDQEEEDSGESEDREDGQISDSDSNLDEEDMNIEIQKCMKNGNLEKLKAMLKTREEENSKLRRDLAKEKEKEKREKEMKSVLKKLQQANRTRSDLRRSIASSRNTTPSASPKKKTHKQQKDQRRVIKKKKENEETNRPDKKSEYNDVLESFLKLKQGRADKYSDLMLEAMEATDNILSLKEDRDSSSDNELNTRKPQSRKSKHKHRAGTQVPQVNKRVEAIDPKTSNRCECDSVLETLMQAVKHLALSEETNKTEAISAEKTEALLHKLVNGKQRQEETIVDRTIAALNSDDNDDTSPGERGSRGNKKGKLTSGKCVKPDESEIQRVVKFAHQKLDPTHVKTREFDKLPFNLLIAGEIELITSDITSEEKEARLSIAKTLCYHKNYLCDEDLRDGYDEIMKSIERKQQDWNAALGEHLHEILGYRANVIVREKLNAAAEANNGGSFTKVENKKSADRRKDEEGSERIIYCQDYNSNKCPHPSHHEGRFAGNKVTKWHYCKKCLVKGDRRTHRPMEDSCPLKTA